MWNQQRTKGWKNRREEKRKSNRDAMIVDKQLFRLRCMRDAEEYWKVDWRGDVYYSIIIGRQQLILIIDSYNSE